MTTVRNPNFPDNEYVFSLPSREAVLAAFALFTVGDANSWGWEKRFGDKPIRTPHGWACGDWWAREGKEHANVT